MFTEQGMDYSGASFRESSERPPLSDPTVTGHKIQDCLLSQMIRSQHINLELSSDGGGASTMLYPSSRFHVIVTKTLEAETGMKACVLMRKRGQAFRLCLSYPGTKIL